MTKKSKPQPQAKADAKPVPAWIVFGFDQANKLRAASWDEIDIGHLVLATETPDEGYWQTIVVAKDNDMLTLKWVGYLGLPAVGLPPHRSGAAQTHRSRTVNRSLRPDGFDHGSGREPRPELSFHSFNQESNCGYHHGYRPHSRTQ